MKKKQPYNKILPFIIGTGAATAVGFNALINAASVRAEITRISAHPFMVDSRGNSFITAHAQYLPTSMGCFNRLCQLGMMAAKEAIKDIKPELFPQLTIIIGLPNIRPGFSMEMAEKIKTCFKQNLFGQGDIKIETICAGGSAGLMAVEKGCRLISKSPNSLCLAGGIESWIDPDTLEWLDYQGDIHSGANPWGFVPGEGAGFCLMASQQWLEKQDIRASAIIRGWGAATEHNMHAKDAVCTAEGLSSAIHLATQEANQVDQIICDRNGQRAKADEFGFAFLKHRKLIKDPKEIVTPFDFWGDTGAAAGPLFISLATHTACHTPQNCMHLLVTGSSSGERNAILLETLH